jgi:hypothetical protein
METITKKKLIGEYPILTRSDWTHQGFDHDNKPESVDGITFENYYHFTVQQANNINDQRFYWIEGKNLKGFDQDYLRVPLQYFNAYCTGDTLQPKSEQSLVILHPTGQAKCYYLAGEDIVDFFKNHHGIHEINIDRPNSDYREEVKYWKDLGGDTVWGKTCFNNFNVCEDKVSIHRLCY